MNFQEAIEKIKNELKLRNYSCKTIKSYLSCLLNFFCFIGNIGKNPDINVIKKYLLEKQNKGQLSQIINLYFNTIKYFYRDMMKSLILIDLRFVKV